MRNRSAFFSLFTTLLSLGVSGCVSQRDTVVLGSRSAPLITATETAPVKKTFNLQKTVAVNSSLTLMSSVKLALDCTPQKIDEQVEIVQQPQHGRVETTTETIFPQFPMGIPQYACNAKRVPARVITYTPDKDYVGPDSVTTEAIDTTSDLTRTYAITVK